MLDGGLREVAFHIEAMRDGNLTTRPHAWGDDEVARLMATLSAMQTSLREIVAQVRGASDGIVTAAGEISAGSMDLSSRTERSAANLEQSAAAMEEVAVTTQTTALAARAGESGRGFAVVASEVRALAGRSAQAAREIKSSIGSSVDQVESGTRVVNEAGSTMQTLVGNASRVNQLLAAIATGIDEQAQGVRETTASVQELDRSTQQNAALVEQSAAAAASLDDQARGLAARVSAFQLSPAA